MIVYLSLDFGIIDCMLLANILVIDKNKNNKL